MSELLERQVESLLVRVRDAAAQARFDLESDANAQVRSILDAARRDARAVVRAAARAKRERVAERCRQARAASETRDRSSAFAQDGELTRRARLALPSAIERRWRDPAMRREWCRAALAVASRRLVGRDWTSAVAIEVSTAERDELVATAAGLGASLTWSAEAPPALGLRIVAGGACVDATLDGLLADAAAVEARVLAVLRGLASRAGEP